MSSDSSDDENLELIREATDSQFINDSMYTKSEGNDVKIPQVEQLPPSLRVVEDNDDQFKLFRVTPQFQNYVAKALSRKLEEHLRKSLKTYPPGNKKRKKIHDCVKLLKSSKSPIDIKVENNNCVKNIHKHDNNFKDVDMTVVIKGKDVLNSKEIKHWSNRNHKDDKLQKFGELAPSLRIMEEKEDQFKVCNVTPQFQNDIAKELSRKLDDLLRKRLKTYPLENQKRKHPHDSIKLLKCSKYPIDIKDGKNHINVIAENTRQHNNKFKNVQSKKRKIIMDESDLQSVVITGEDVLNQKEIKHWSNRSKAPVFLYTKDTNGILHFMPPKFV